MTDLNNVQTAKKKRSVVLAPETISVSHFRGCFYRCCDELIPKYKAMDVVEDQRFYQQL